MAWVPGDNLETAVRLVGRVEREPGGDAGAGFDLEEEVVLVQGLAARPLAA
jgi:hypothetical protein